jgi:hypothetical protein
MFISYPSDQNCTVAVTKTHIIVRIKFFNVLYINVFCIWHYFA